MNLQNPKLYEINTRVWIHNFENATLNNQNRKVTFDDIPDEYWNNLAEKGINIVWLMGIWKTNSSGIKKYCFKDYLIRNYERVNRDWKEDDIIGSPFAIDSYELNPAFGDCQSLVRLRKKLNKYGLKLFLDFIPNHFSAESRLIKSNPGIFLSIDEESYKRDPHSYFKAEGSESYFAHGRDPFFPVWEDTVRINYFSPEAVDFMINTLNEISGLCDGVRCDMAMLILDNIFYNTWCGALNKSGYKKPEATFWKIAIEKIKGKFPDFIFMAETYWDLEWTLQQLGFDYTYDKRLTERLIHGSVSDIKIHLMTDVSFQKKLVRFLENHDEERAASVLSKNKLMAASVIISTIPGMHFYFDGQFEGKKIKLPVQMGRDPQESVSICIREFYNKLLNITKDKIFTYGNWQLLNALPSWEENSSYNNLLVWNWTYKEENRLIVVNYSDQISQGRIKLDLKGYGENLQLVDLLNDMIYIRSYEEIYHMGLFIELKSYHSHIFSY